MKFELPYTSWQEMSMAKPTTDIIIFSLDAELKIYAHQLKSIELKLKDSFFRPWVKVRKEK